MAELKTPLEYEKIICEKTTSWYNNFMSNISEILTIPKNIKSFYDKNKELKKQEDIENLGKELDQTFNEWKSIKGIIEEAILVNHFMSVLQNAAIVLESLKLNLKKDDLPIGVIHLSNGIDIMITTGVQMFAVKADQITKKYLDLKLENDKNMYFNQLNKNLLAILEQNAEQAFGKYLENIMEFSITYLTVYDKLTKQEVSDKFADQRIEMFMECMDAYYLLSFMLILALTYPFQNGVMDEKSYNSLLPKFEIFK